MFNIIETANQYSASHIAPCSLSISHGEGTYVYDYNGKAYIDMTSGISVTNFGHKHPRLMKALIDQANRIAILPQNIHHKPFSLLLKRACKLWDMDKAIAMNSGAEVVETAIKLARKWSYTVKKIPKDQADIIVCNNSFHGRTVTIVSMSSVEHYKKDFGPLTPGFTSIPFNDINALKKAITPHTAAFITEPIQGEAGVIIPDDGYLKACEDICKTHNVLFIVDEIQTGMGRTGKPLAMQYDQVKPDGILLGKALGGGLLPISLFLGKEPLMSVIKPGQHGSTFGGNPLASFVAYEAINTLIDDNLSQNSAELGSYFLNQLQSLKSPAITEIRGKGLFIAIELNTQIVKSHTIFEKLIENGLLSLDNRHKIIRLLPPLTITKSTIDKAVDIIQQTFNNALDYIKTI